MTYLSSLERTSQNLADTDREIHPGLDTEVNFCLHSLHLRQTIQVGTRIFSDRLLSVPSGWLPQLSLPKGVRQREFAPGCCNCL